MAGSLLVCGWVAVALVVAQRLIWIAPTRLGWVYYFANIVGEVGPKWLGLNRGLFDGLVGAAGAGLLVVGGLDHAVLAWVVASMLGLVVVIQAVERRLLDAVWVRKDGIGPAPTSRHDTRGLSRGYPSPSTHPQLTINLVGPFVRRRPRFSLGTLVVGRSLRLEVVVGNHAMTPTQTGVRLRVGVPASLMMAGPAEFIIPPLAPGAVERVTVDLEVAAPSMKAEIDLSLEWGDACWRECLMVDQIVAELPRVTHAEIRRYPGAARAAFAWRGDMDLYDTSTMQSIEGLEETFGLAAKYRMPQTMYLSTRLAVDLDEAQKWSTHYGIDRGAERIPAFLEWMRANVEFRHWAEYPFDSTKPFVIELGNHGHLHYGTDTSAAEENGWAPRVRMGAGIYPWARDARNSFEEQRDNAMEARRQVEAAFDFTPKSWAMPDRTRDETTPRAMEAAGCEVLSDSDVRTRDNVLFQPRPHFAPGSDAVELTKRYPGDPMGILHYAMNLFWMHRAHRLGMPVVFMCHQHMRLYEGWACTRFTEAILRYVLEGFGGDLWISTVYGVGVYWRDILSEKRRAAVTIEEGQARVEYSGSLEYTSVPLDLTLEGGGRATVLVDLTLGSSLRVDARGAVA